MLLPKDCITITQDEAKTLLSLLGIKSLSFPWEIAQRAIKAPRGAREGTYEESKTVYNLITAVKKLEEAAYSRCYDCAAYDPAED